MSYASIEGFKSVITGVQRTSLFEVYVTLPSILATDSNTLSSTNFAEKFKFTCKEAPIPESTLGIVEVPYMGRKVKFFGDRQYNDWSTTVLVDEQWATYSTIYNWHWLMNSPNGNKASSTSKKMNDYKGVASIVAYDIQGVASLAMTLHGFWPSSLQELSFSWENTDSMAEVQVTWAYDYATAGISSSSEVNTGTKETSVSSGIIKQGGGV